ncbi:MAG: acyl-CoA synthetase [Alphaproteobacteria bacterium]|jgi:fatty-acyl-CoA synthase|nr:acyl-CoA synthetase [Alphaproteobacteria bacterium]
MTDRPIRSLADIEAIEREMPWDERAPAHSTYALLEGSAARFPDRPAIHFLPNGRADDVPVILSYAALFARVTQTANLFHDLGIRPGKAVSYLLPNLPQTHFVIWGGQAAGIVNAINPLLDAGHIAEILAAADSRVLVTMAPEAAPDLWRKVEAVRAMLPRLDTVLVIGGKADPARGILAFDDEVARRPADRLVSGRRIEPDEICAYFHTGGTTGAPKLARHTHRGEVYEAWVMSTVVGMTMADTLLLGLPLFHVNAVMVTGLAPFLVGAATVMLSPSGYRHPDVIPQFWRVVERYRATSFSGVPTIYAALLNVPIGDADVSSLRFAICGAAPMPVELFRRFEAATGIRILEGYGMTEGTCASSVNPFAGERRVGSIGLRYPYQPMKTVKLKADGSHDRDCAVDEIGVVTFSGPNAFPGYVQDKHNKAAFVAPGWVNSGDLGRQDADGYFWLTGRAKDLIIRGGHNIDPQMIEEVLHRHPAVALAAAVGRPDVYAGEVPVAYVEFRPGLTADPEDLRRFARENIFEPPAAPAEVIPIAPMPVTAVGKIFKPTLRHDATRRVYDASLHPLREQGWRVTVTVAAHDLYGTLATVALAGSGDRGAAGAEVARLLGGYAIRHEVCFT